MESPVERFYRRHAPFYDLTRRFVLRGRSRAIARLGVVPGCRVLDFACGTGLNVGPLERAGAGEIVGVDLSDAMLARARRKHPGVRFVRGDMRHVDLGGAAPRVICTYGLSQLREPLSAIRNFHRHVAPGGRLVLLDFGRPAGPAGRMLAAWLAAFHAQAPQGVEGDLDPLFDRTEVAPLGWGAVLWIAEGPRKTVHADPIPVESNGPRREDP